MKIILQMKIKTISVKMMMNLIMNLNKKFQMNLTYKIKKVNNNIIIVNKIVMVLIINIQVSLRMNM